MTAAGKKKIFLSAAALVFCALTVLAFLTLKDYAHRVPIIIGPFRSALFILLAFLLAAALGFAFGPVNKRTTAGTVCLAFSILWFTGKMLLSHKMPDSPLLPLMDQWMPVPLLCFGIGAFLWISVFLPEPDARSAVSEKWLFAAALLFVFIVLQPVLKGGFNWDDAFFSVKAQVMRTAGESIFKRVWVEVLDYVRIGRINPFATFHFLVFYFIPDPRAYRLLILVLSLLNAALFYRFIKLWGGNYQKALMVMLIIPLCFQFRFYHDPLNSYYGLMQVMFCELMGALILNIRWLREGKRSCLLFSLVFFTMGLMSYEMFFPLTVLFLVTALSVEKDLVKALKRTLPYILPAVILFALSLLLRTNITEETAYNGTTFSLDIPVIFRTFSYQSGAAFPLRYRLAGYDAAIFGETIPWKELFNTSLPVLIRSIQWQDLLACAIFSAVILSVRKERMEASPFFLLFGLLLWLLPGLVISLSEKYQNVLKPGLPYIPIYFSYFGMGLLLYETAAFLQSKMKGDLIRILVCGCGCAILLVTLQDNRHINDRLNEIFYYPRIAGEEALQAGILGEITDKTVISEEPFNLWEQGWAREPYQSDFYSLNARTNVSAIGYLDFAAAHEGPNNGWVMPENTSVIYYTGDQQGGFAKSGRLRGTGFDPESRELINTMVTDVYYFVSGEYQNGMVLLYKTKDHDWVSLSINEKGWLISKTENGALYKLEEKRSVFFDTITITRETLMK